MSPEDKHFVPDRFFKPEYYGYRYDHDRNAERGGSGSQPGDKPRKGCFTVGCDSSRYKKRKVQAGYGVFA